MDGTSPIIDQIDVLDHLGFIGHRIRDMARAKKFRAKTPMGVVGSGV